MTTTKIKNFLLMKTMKQTSTNKQTIIAYTSFDRYKTPLKIIKQRKEKET